MYLADVARRNVAAFPAVCVVNAAFESWPLPPERFDAVVAVTAFHWIDPAVRVSKSAETLRPSAHGKRLVFDSNALRVIDGPFSESKELIGGFSIMRLDSIDEAIALSRRYAEILGGNLELDIRELED